MQKFSSLGRTALRGAIFGLSAFVVFMISVAIASETTGGKFGEVLNNILASGNWENSDGTVKNALKFNGESVENFQKIGEKRTCEANKCVAGFDEQNNVICR